MITRSDFEASPFSQFEKWYKDATQSQIKNPDAMTLATATPDGIPSARVVLFKGLNEKGLRFFTNYESRKARELQLNPYASVVFYWSSLDRQVRVEGKIETLSSIESDEYWLSRPRESRIGALASQQSMPIAYRKMLENRVDELSEQFKGKEIPRPENWGGYVLIPNRFEFWFAGDNRLHDRFCYLKKEGGIWELIQLAP